MGIMAAISNYAEINNHCRVITGNTVVSMLPGRRPDTMQEYLHQTLGLVITPVAIGDLAERLPAFVRNRYHLSGFQVMGYTCLALTARGRSGAAEDVAKHGAVVRAQWPGPVVYITETITPSLRRRCIAGRTPFIVPGRQAYLPFLAMDIQERPLRPRVERDALRPATQAVLVWWLYHGMNGRDTPTRLVDAVGYTLMSLSRVFDELEHLQREVTGFVIERHGRERRARWTGSAQGLWEALSSHLRDPVRERILLRRDGAVPPGLPGGLDGLARCSDLAAPPRPVLAISHDDWLQFQRDAQPMATDPDDLDAVEVEVWRYATDLHRQEPGATLTTADPLSLVIGLRHAGLDQDERVDQAIRHAVAEVPWRW